MARFKIGIDRAGQFRWNLIANNGEVVAVSEAYTTKYSAKLSAERVKELAGNASIDD